jgi:uncharacterized membrane protein
MRYSDLKLLGKICAVVGFLSILFAIFAYFYMEEPWWGIGYWVQYPYRDYAIPLVFLGIVLLAIGYLLETAKEEKTEPTVPAPSSQQIPKGRFCSQCGKLVSVGEKFCPNCGKESKTD